MRILVTSSSMWRRYTTVLVDNNLYPSVSHASNIHNYEVFWSFQMPLLISQIWGMQSIPNLKYSELIIKHCNINESTLDILLFLYPNLTKHGTLTIDILANC